MISAKKLIYKIVQKIANMDTDIAAKQKQITVSTTSPTAGDGEDGDIWLVYTP